MTAQQLRALKYEVPFKPFIIRMNDGRHLQVREPEALVLPRDWTVDALVTLPRGRFEFVYLKNVTSVESEGKWPKMKGRRRRGRDSGEGESE